MVLLSLCLGVLIGFTWREWAVRSLRAMSKRPVVRVHAQGSVTVASAYQPSCREQAIADIVSDYNRNAFIVSAQSAVLGGEPSETRC